MSIKLAVLKSGENIISEMKEGILDEKIVCYILENPCSVSITGKYTIDNGDNQYSVSFNRWPLLSKDTTVQIAPNWIITVVEPVDTLKNLYETQVLGESSNEPNESDQSNSVIEQSDTGLTD